MKTRNQIYEKYGETAEAAQLLETEIGTLLLEKAGEEYNLFENINTLNAKAILDRINKSTLGQLIKNFNSATTESDFSTVLATALVSRNKLAHSFFREHNIRINSSDGRKIMFEDLENIHTEIFFAYKQLLLISGIDLENLSDFPVEFSADHLKI